MSESLAYDGIFFIFICSFAKKVVWIAIERKKRQLTSHLYTPEKFLPIFALVEIGGKAVF